MQKDEILRLMPPKPLPKAKFYRNAVRIIETKYPEYKIVSVAFYEGKEIYDIGYFGNEHIIIGRPNYIVFYEEGKFEIIDSVDSFMREDFDISKYEFHQIGKHFRKKPNIVEHVYKVSNGEMVFENTIVKKLDNGMYIGDAERNIIVNKHDRHNDNTNINLCAHYNVFDSENNTFDLKYHYYLTKYRMLPILHWTNGKPWEEHVIEKYDDLNEARNSKYYNDFKILKENIDKEILRKYEEEESNFL